MSEDETVVTESATADDDINAQWWELIMESNFKKYFCDQIGLKNNASNSKLNSNFEFRIWIPSVQSTVYKPHKLFYMVDW